MLLPLVNEPRDYAWGSTTLIAELEGRAPTGRPEAEVWFGDHPGRPRGGARTGGRSGSGSRTRAPRGRAGAAAVPAEAAGRGIPPLDPGASVEGAGGGGVRPRGGGRHPARRRGAHLPRRQPQARADRRGQRDLHRARGPSAPSTPPAGSSTHWGRPVRRWRARLDAPDEAGALRDAIAWLLSGDAQAEVDAIISAVGVGGGPGVRAPSSPLPAGIIGAAYPGDPGVVVALLMNLVVLHRGEAVFVPAGVLHAYLAGPRRRADGGERQRAARRPHAQAHRRRGAADGARSDPRTAADPSARAARRRDRALRRRGMPDFALLHAAGRPTTPRWTCRSTGVAIALATRGSVESPAAPPGRTRR